MYAEDLHTIASKSEESVSYKLGEYSQVMTEAKSPSLLQAFFCGFSVSKYWKIWLNFSGFSYIK